MPADSSNTEALPKRRLLADADLKLGDMYFDGVAQRGYVLTPDGWRHDEHVTEMDRLFTWNPHDRT